MIAPTDLRCEPQARHLGSIVVYDHEVGALQSLHLMYHQVASLVVTVIRHNNTLCKTNNEVVTLYSLHLMYHQVTSLVVTVIRHNNTLWDIRNNVDK